MNYCDIALNDEDVIMIFYTKREKIKTIWNGYTFLWKKEHNISIEKVDVMFHVTNETFQHILDFFTTNINNNVAFMYNYKKLFTDSENVYVKAESMHDIYTTMMNYRTNFSEIYNEKYDEIKKIWER